MTATWKRAYTAWRWAGMLLLVIVIACAFAGGIAAFIAMIAGLTGAVSPLPSPASEAGSSGSR